MDTSTSIRVNTPLHHYVRAMAVMSRLMTERLTLAVPLRDVAAELPDLNEETISTLIVMAGYDIRVRYPDPEDLGDAIVYLGESSRHL